MKVTDEWNFRRHLTAARGKGWIPSKGKMENWKQKDSGKVKKKAGISRFVDSFIAKFQFAMGPQAVFLILSSVSRKARAHSSYTAGYTEWKDAYGAEY